MANNSFRNFGRFNRSTSKAADNGLDNDALAEKLAKQHQEALDYATAYNEWASTTLLSDVVVPLADGRKFSELFEVGEGADGEPVVIFNPGAPNGSSWSKNESGMVNALLCTFGTRRYGLDLHHGRHDRPFDKSLVIEHNVRSEYNSEINRWSRMDWNNQRFTANTPNPRSDEGAGWLSKHIEMDRMILALIGKQSLTYHFFNRIAWTRFESNVLQNMQNLVSKVNVLIGNQAEMATTIRKTERKNDQAQAAGTAVTTTGVIVDGVDLKKVGGVVKVEVKMKYASNPVTRTIDTNDAGRIAYVSNTLADKDCEYIRLVK